MSTSFSSHSNFHSGSHSSTVLHTKSCEKIRTAPISADKRSDPERKGCEGHRTLKKRHESRRRDKTGSNQGSEEDREEGETNGRLEDVHVIGSKVDDREGHREVDGGRWRGLMTSNDVVCSLVPHWWWCSGLDVTGVI